jgi:putative spermidine/putrescine transport system permease protein
LPLIPLAIWSFARGWRFPSILPPIWSTQAWEYAVSDTSGVLQSLGVTLWIAVCATALSILVGVPAGRALGLYRFRGKGIVELMILAPVIVPGIAVALGIHSVFIGLGLTNTVSGVILVHLIPTLPYMVLVMAGIFANYDPAFEQQARSLGASPLQTFWHVTLPAIRPGIIIGGLFAFLVSWSQYILTLLIGGGRVETLPLLLFNFATSGRNDITGAIAMIYVLPGLLILIVTARHLSGQNGAVGGFGRV